MKRTSILAAVLATLALGFGPGRATAHDFENRSSGETSVFEALQLTLASEPQGSTTHDKLFSFIAQNYVWPKNTPLRVCFWDAGQEALKAKVETYATDVAKGLPVTFVWKSGGAYYGCTQDNYYAFPVRVSLSAKSGLLAGGDNPYAFFAVIGVAGKDDNRRATMNLPFDAGAPDAMVQNRVKHEFCHVLGCLHEHQRGLCQAAFDKVKIMAAKGLSEAQYKSQYEEVADQKMGPQAFGPFDPTSIMMYTFSPDLFQSPPFVPPAACLHSGETTVLSSRDRNGLAQAYKDQPGLPKTFAALAARHDVLAAQALTLRQSAVQLRFAIQQPIPNGPSKWLGLTAWRNAGDLRKADRLEGQVADLEAERDAYAFRPETLQRLQAALALGVASKRP